MADGVQARCGDSLLHQLRHDRPGTIHDSVRLACALPVESVCPSTQIAKSGVCFIIETTCSRIGPDSGLIVAVSSVEENIQCLRF